MLNLNLSMTVQIGSLGFQLIVQDNEWEPYPTMLRFLSVEEKKKLLIFRLCHMKVTACQEDSTPEAKHAVILFSRVCMCILVFPHLQVACGIQKVRSGFPGHFPFYLLKQGLLLNPKLVESSNLTNKLLRSPIFLPSTGITGSLHGHLARRVSEKTNSGPQVCRARALPSEPFH